MSWNGDKTDDRNMRSGRDRRIDMHAGLRFSLATFWFKDLVALVESTRPKVRTGRPRRHAAATEAFMFLLSFCMASQAEADLFINTGSNWRAFRRVLRTAFPDEPLLGDSAPPPTRSVIRHLKKRLGEDAGWSIATIMAAQSFSHSIRMGVGVNHGTLLEPSLEAGIFGDGVVISPMTKHKRGDTSFSERKGCIQERRVDPDATYYVDGTGTKVYGNEFIHMSARTGFANEIITFGIRPLRKGGKETESEIALAMAKNVKQNLPGMAMVHYDKALRGRSVEEIWDMRMMPMVGVYDKTGRSTEHVPLGKKTINGVGTQLFAYRGAVCIRDADGNFKQLTPTKLIYMPNAADDYRVYCDYVVPDSINCDTRLWGGAVTQRMNSPKRADFVYGEHVRAHAPGSAGWKKLYGHRSLAESLNSWMKTQLLWEKRARSLNQTHQWIDLMLILMLRNDRSLMLYQQRSPQARTAPPRAA